jgi:Ca-activated chloride channel family protein
VRFGNPWWLLAVPIACAALVWIWHRYDVRQNAALSRFVAAHLRDQLTRSVSVARRRIRRGLLLAAIACLCAALAGPLVGFRWELISRRGNEIVFAIDTSRSMLTADVKPNRLVRAKLAIDDFANQLDGDAVGIVAFAGSAFLICPITLDYGAFHETLNAIDTNTIARGGTNIESAIAEAQHALHRHPGADKILILVTDGEDLEGSAVAAARNAAQQDHLKIYAVGVGTAAGDLIALPADQGGGYVKDETGALVKSHLDEDKLKAIAAATGGFYVPLGAEGEGLQLVLKTVLDTIDQHDLSFRQQRVYIERYQWPLATSFALLVASLLIGPRRRTRVRRTASIGVAALSSLVLFAAWPNRPVRAASPTAEDSKQKSDTASSGPVDSVAQPRDSVKPVPEFNSGTAAYRAGRFPQAAQAFEQSIKRLPSSDAKRVGDQEDAYYDLGNTLYRAGQKSEQSAPQEALRQWTDAVKAYETALQLRSDDPDSKFNRDLVKRKIEALRQQQNQPPQSQPPPKSNGGSPPDKGAPQISGQPPAAPGVNRQPPAEGGAEPRDDPRLPGQMSREEASELLDSAKGEEHPPPAAPLASMHAIGEPPEKPFKNW